MTFIRADDSRWKYSNSIAHPNPTGNGTNATSLGGRPPPDAGFANFEPYRQAALDAAQVDLSVLTDTQIDNSDPSSRDPKIGDLGVVLDGPAARHRFRVTDVDYVAHTITIDRPTPAAAQPGNQMRTARPGPLFLWDEVTETEARDGLVDYRILWFIHNTSGPVSGYQFFIDEGQALGCQLEMLVGDAIHQDVVSANGVPILSDRFENPLEFFGNPDGGGLAAPLYGDSDGMKRWNRSLTTPFGGSVAMQNNDFLPVIFRRTIPPGARPGQPVFWVGVKIDDPTLQDPAAEPDPFESTWPVTWDIAEPTGVQLEVSADRQPISGGEARIVGTARYSNGNAIVGWPARIVFSGAAFGELVAPALQRTDANGQIVSTYRAPSSEGTATFELQLD